VPDLIDPLGVGPLDLGVVRHRVAAYRPRAKPDAHRDLWAATAMLVAPGSGGPARPDILFIQRPQRPGDRWSGQMALPGGKRDPTDASALDAALREAREEVGLELGEPVGRLDDVRGRALRRFVATYVFTLDERPTVVPAPAEVAAAVWVPLDRLLSAEAAFRYTYGAVGRFAAIRHGEHVIWGLTHRIVGSLAQALGVPLPHAGTA
jgi:8-oxo-dGTP pyrophosphatase MutT (NUDIX family)